MGGGGGGGMLVHSTKKHALCKNYEVMEETIETSDGTHKKHTGSAGVAELRVHSVNSPFSGHWNELGRGVI